MYTVQIDFKIVNLSKCDDQLDLIHSLLGSWRMNGQVLGREFPISHKKKTYSAFVLTPDKNSLSSRYNNRYTRKYLRELTDKFSPAKISVLGLDPCSSSACNCKDPNFYILFTTYLSLESPLRCGECFGSIPLYTIPKTYDDEYYDIICWMSDYQSCDGLQMNCRVGERFSTNQLSNLDSPLTKLGLKVCDSIQKATGKKAYYYLYKGAGKSYESETARTCPGCNGPWYQKRPAHDIFDFACHTCCLLSNIAWNCR